MIIGFDAKRAFFNKSGLGNYSRNTILQLSQFFPENSYFLYTPGISSNINFTTPENAKLVLPDTAFSRIFSSYWRTVKLGKKLTADGIQIFHGLSNELPANINRSRVASTVTIHDLIFIRYPELYKPIDRKIYEKKFINACRNADKVIAISEQTKSDIVNFFKIDESRIDVVYQGCDNAFQRIVDADEKKRVKSLFNLPDNFILYVGTVEKRKNVLSAIKAIHEGRIDMPIVVVGRKTAYQEDLDNYIRRNNVKKVFFYDNVGFKELPAIYQMADLFVYPSTFEGFGIPIIEALFSCVPVITTRGGCFSEAGGPASIYVNPESTEEFSNAIKLILENTEKHVSMQKAGIEYSQRFTDKNVAESLMSHYKKLLK